MPAPPSINAKGHILIDYHTGKVISEENADMQLAPASLTKMMTSYIIGTEIASGNISTTDKVAISKNAWATGNPVFKGSSLMFLEVEQKFLFLISTKALL